MEQKCIKDGLKLIDWWCLITLNPQKCPKCRALYKKYRLVVFDHAKVSEAPQVSRLYNSMYKVQTGGV